MIDQEQFFKALHNQGVCFYTGVPDSYLNAFCTYLTNNVSSSRHIIAANEGNAIGLATGYHFATGTVPLVYMQNSGMGNALNPLASLADKYVYAVPMVLLIGWRGDPEVEDHIQHKTQGRITTLLLDILDIPYVVVKDDDDAIEETVSWAVRTAKDTSTPTALIAPKGIFAERTKRPVVSDNYPMSREKAIAVILDNTPKDTLFVATTGRAARELYHLREARGETHACDVLNVGSMGHASSIAMGIAQARNDRLVVCLDGDAAAIMHLGALTTVSMYDMPNFLHIILNNGVHESVGGQPSAGHVVDFTKIAQGSGYRVHVVETEQSMITALKEVTDGKAASFIDVRIRNGLRPGLPPLDITNSHQLKTDFMERNIRREAAENE
jgi:phosphonopyruvate decarboxylase